MQSIYFDIRYLRTSFYFKCKLKYCLTNTYIYNICVLIYLTKVKKYGKGPISIYRPKRINKKKSRLSYLSGISKLREHNTQIQKEFKKH